MTLDAIRLPDEIEQGSTGGPQFYTSVLRLASGAEARNQNWIDAKSVWDISYGVTRSGDDGAWDTIVTFFRARRGRLRGFLFKDWTDYQAYGQVCNGTVDGTNAAFQLQKVYDDTLVVYLRKITRPVAGTLNVYDNGVPTTAFALGTLGVINFTTAPLAGHVITADFEFDVPVRFDNDTLALNVLQSYAASVGSITITEILE